MRKFMQIFCLLLALLFVLSACGGATEQNDEGKDTDEGNNTQNGGTTDEGEGSTGEGSGEEAPNPDAGLSLDKNEVELKVGLLVAQPWKVYPLLVGLVEDSVSVTP